MRAVFLSIFLGVSGVLLGEVQWGGSSSIDETKINTEFTDKKLEYKTMTPDEFGKDANFNYDDKEFSSKNFSLFDKEYDFGKKEFTTKTLDFGKDYPTKTLDYFSKPSPFGDEISGFKMENTAWESRKVAKGFDKKIDIKEYTGPEAQEMKKDVKEVISKLNSMHDLPDHDLTVDEVRELLNNDHAPGAKFLEPTQPVEPVSPKSPVQ